MTAADGALAARRRLDSPTAPVRRLLGPLAPPAHRLLAVLRALARGLSGAPALPSHGTLGGFAVPVRQLLAVSAVLTVTGAAALTGGASGDNGHAAHTAAAAHAADTATAVNTTHAWDGTVAVGLLWAVLAVTLAFAWPALRVAVAPGARRLTGRCVLFAAAAAAVLAVPLLLVRTPGGMDTHVWAMVRFESLAVLGPALLARAVGATGPPSARERGGARLGAAVWTVSAYAWHLPPLHGLDGPGIELARSFSWVTAGVLLCRHPASPRGPFLAAHLAALPLAAVMATTGRGAAGLVMAAADAAMAVCVLKARRRKGCYTRVNIGSNY
ncbi:hypothetical protein ABZ725_50015 [Streptomyces sp. NPDC006872]|uniref:hypothetical protein n=1 Tax=Streptomyces sp. NPDC006872 TaxID=3155720 RepID=UPI00340E1A7A